MPHCLHVTIIRSDSLEHFNLKKIQVEVNSLQYQAGNSKSSSLSYQIQVKKKSKCIGKLKASIKSCAID